MSLEVVCNLQTQYLLIEQDFGVPHFGLGFELVIDRGIDVSVGLVVRKQTAKWWVYEFLVDDHNVPKC